MRIDSLIRRQVDTANLGETVQAIAHRMMQRNVGTLVVVDAAGRPVGIVTDRDLVTRVLAKRRDPAETHVDDVMTRRPYTITEEATADVALLLMSEGGFRRVPVVGADRELVGILSLDDVLRALVADMDRASLVLESQTPERAAALAAGGARAVPSRR